jgi:hypothetical protein
MNPLEIKFKKSHAYILKVVLAQVEPSKVEEWEKKAAPLVDKATLDKVIEMTRNMTDPKRFDQALDQITHDRERHVCFACPYNGKCPKILRGS